MSGMTGWDREPPGVPVRYLPPAPAMLETLRAAGFAAVVRTPLSGGITQLFSATRETP